MTDSLIRPLASPMGAESPPEELADPSAHFSPTIVPTSQQIPAIRSQSSLTPVVCDERAIARLLEMLLSKAGLSVHEAARRMGVHTNVIRQYIAGRRSKPSLIWFIKFANLCGASVTISFPEKR